MQDFWNADGQLVITGLDVLGVRQVDQRIEQDWVQSITTISARLRYLSLLCWVVGEHYLRLGLGDPDAATLKVDPQSDELQSALQRLEFVVMAATIPPGGGRSDDKTQLIGTDKYQDERDALHQQGSIALPDAGSSSVLGVYSEPAAAFGLFRSRPDFVRLLPRGRQLHALKRQRLLNSEVAQRIFDGGELALDDLRAEAHEFSANGIPQCVDEQAKLLEFMRAPYRTDEARVLQGSARFWQTTTTAFEAVNAQPASSTELIARAYLASNDPRVLREVEIAWARFELHRRVHHALELLFSSLVQELNACEQASVSEIVENLTDGEHAAEAVVQLMDWPQRPFDVPVAELLHLPEEFLANRLNRADARDLSKASRAQYALCMLASDAAFSRGLRQISSLHKTTAATLRLVECDPQRSAAALLLDLMQQVVVPEHLATSLRKMGNRGKPTLRFYREGEVLRSTGNRVLPGYSGDRLANVLVFWADLGALERHPGRRVQLTDWGRELLAEEVQP